MCKFTQSPHGKMKMIKSNYNTMSMNWAVACNMIMNVINWPNYYSFGNEWYC